MAGKRVPQVERTCLHCGNTFKTAKAFVQFCSKECRYLHIQSKAFENNAGQVENAVRQDEEDVADEKLARAWQRAGIVYDAMTRKALNAEKRDTGKRRIIISGYGASMNVKRDALVIKYGTSYEPQELLAEELNRGVHDVYRIIWCAASGTITYDATNWCAQNGIDVVVLNRDGQIVSETCAAGNDAHVLLKRAQYGLSTERLCDIATWIVLGKVMAQLETYNVEALRNNKASSIIASELSMLSNAPLHTLQDIRLAEARIARMYFDSWIDIALNWAKPDRDKIPAHWRMVGKRNSVISGDATRPVCPAQAILNYAYGILTHTTRCVLLAYGFDTSVGILHSDQSGRQSLVYDLMEFGRGAVDEMVLHFLKQTEFHKGDFIARSDGSVSLHPELCRAVTAVCRINQEFLAEKAQMLKNMVLIGMPEK